MASAAILLAVMCRVACEATERCSVVEDVVLKDSCLVVAVCVTEGDPGVLLLFDFGNDSLEKIALALLFACSDGV